MKKNLIGSSLRLYIALTCLAGSFIGFVEPRSLFYLIANGSDHFGIILLWSFTVLGFIGLFDVIINDLMPVSYKMSSGLKVRHFVYMGISVAYAAEMFVGIHYSDAWSSFPLFVIHSVFSAFAAFLDVYIRLGSRTENDQIKT